MSVVPVIIVTGFLGAGKTSFLRHLIPLCGEAQVRPALIVNEVGDVDVDGELLADLHAEQVRLVGGCVCCTLQAQLSSTLYDVLDNKSADVIIIECSGLSNPLDVLSALSAPALLQRLAVSHIVCTVDARKAEKVLKVAELAKDQIATADLVILNKVDLIADEQRAAVEALIDRLAPRAERRWASHGDVGRDRLLAVLTDPAPSRCTCACGCHHDHEHHHDHHGHEHGHHHAHTLPASFCTVAVPLPDVVDRDALTTMLTELPENVIRAKGFAHINGEGWHTMHRVFTNFEITPVTGYTPSTGAVLVCIGQHLDAEALQAQVNEAVQSPAYP